MGDGPQRMQSTCSVSAKEAAFYAGELLSQIHFPGLISRLNLCDLIRPRLFFEIGVSFLGRP